MTDKTTDRFGPDDIPESRILEIEEYLQKREKEIVDYVEKQTVEDYPPIYEPFDKLLDKLVHEFPSDPKAANPTMIRFTLSRAMLLYPHYGVAGYYNQWSIGRNQTSRRSMYSSS
ncbi:MAG TPA: hypothetical protein VFS97_09225, partial [Nitrososphaeraceae archaeon]|jgi:hypothetical protein|nr:hypothetical protein [Nitrososphaeraceae archaeon]